MKNFLSCCLLFMTMTAASLKDYFQENKTQADVGGIKLVLTKKGLDFAANILVEFLKENIKGARIDNVAGMTDIKVAHIDYWFNNTTITAFTRPSAKVQLNPSKGLNLALNGAGLTATSKWEYKYRAGLIKFGDQGSFKASVKGMSIGVSVSVKKNESGSPKVITTDCKCSIADLQIDLSSGANWFYNILLKLFKNKIRDYFETLVCDEAKNAIDGMTSKYLDKLNMQVQFNDVLFLNYALIADPIFGTDIVSFRLNGRFAGDNVQEMAPVAQELKSDMVSATVSDVTFNSAFRVLHKTRKLYYSLDLDDDIFVRAVFGLLNEAGVSIKGTGLTVSVEPSAPPLVSIKPGNISISGEIEGSIIVKNADGSNSSALTLKVAVYAQLEAWISSNRIFGKVKDFKSNFTYLSSPYSSAKNLKLTIDDMAMLLLPAVNEYLSQGYPIPTLYGIQLQDPLIQVFDRYVGVTSNAAYVGDVGHLLN